MNTTTKNTTTARLLLAAVLAAGLATGSGVANAQESMLGWLLTPLRSKEVKPVTDKAYQSECGECHLAYQPGLLPARSWELLLQDAALRQHFGVSAEVDAKALPGIRDYALANAADRSWRKRSRKIAASTATGPAPLRITEVRSIARTHRDIPPQLVAGNPGVKSLSQCDKCHTQAAEGVYDNDTVAIPNALR